MRILIIDDDPINNFLSRKVFERSNFAVNLSFVNDAKEALALFEHYESVEPANFPELILLDINMPFMSGFELLEEYSRKGWDRLFPETKVIMLSTSMYPQDKEQAKTFPQVIDYFSKPLTIDKIQEIMSYAGMRKVA